MLPRDRSLVPYKSYLPAISPKERHHALRLKESITIGEPVSTITAIAAAVASFTAQAALAVGTSIAVAEAVAVAAYVITAVAIVVGVGYAIYSAVSPPKVPKLSFGSADAGGFAEGSPRYSVGALTNTATSQLPIPALYGQLKLGGNAIWQDQYNVETVNRLVVLCEGEVNSISDIRLNDIPIADLEGCSVTSYVGTSSQTLDSRATGYVNGMRFLAYLALTIKASEKLRGNPVITSVVEGLKIQTWDGNRWSGEGSKTYSRNPAACLRDYLISTRYGVGLPESAIDDASFGEAFDYCADSISDNDGGTQARFQLDVIIDSKRPHLDIINDILATFGAFLIFDGKKLKLRVEKSEAPVQSFGMSNIIEGTFQYEYLPRDAQANRLKVMYIDPDQNYTQVFVMAEDKVNQDLIAAQEGGEGVVQREFALLGITRQSQAQRMAAQYLNLVRFGPILISFRAGIEAIHCQAGDIITISHDVPSWTAKPFRVIATIERQDDEIEVLAREHNPTVYSDRYPATITQFAYGSPRNPLLPIAEVTGLTLTEEGYVNIDGDLISVILVSWTSPADIPNLAGYVIESNKDGEGYRLEVRLDATVTSHRIVKVVHNSTYTIKVRVVSIRDVISTGQTASITVLGVNSPPEDVTGFEISQTATRIVFNWNHVSDHDLWGYEIREGAGGWDSASVVASLVLTNRYDLFQFSAGVKTYMVKAKDNFGNYSNNPGTDTITITASPNANVAFQGDEWFHQDGHFDPTLAEWIPSIDFDPTFFRLAIYPRTNKQFDIGAELPDTFDDMSVPMDMDTNQKTDEIVVLTHVFDAGGSVGGLVTGQPVYRNVNGMTVTRKIQASADGVTFGALTTPSATDPAVGRYFRWALSMQAAGANAPVGLAGFAFQLDVEDIVVTGDNVQIEAGGTTIQLGSTFIAIKAVVAVVRGASGNRSVSPSSISASAITFTVYDKNDVSVADSIDYTIVGY